MIVVVSATSNTGSAVADSLLAHGHPVRALGRNAERLRTYGDRGAEVAAVPHGSADELHAGFRGARAAFVMLAPGLIPDSTDYAAHQRRTISALRGALTDTPGLERVVTLSGWAANYDGARGPVWGLRRLEEAVDTIPGVAAFHLRAGWFMENTLPMIAEIEDTGVSHGLIPADLPLPAIATEDIGTVAAEILAGDRTPSTRVLELPGPADITLAEVTATIGRHLSDPRARYERVDAPTMRAGLLTAGFSAHMADGTVGMTEDVAEGRIRMLRPRDRSTRTRTTFDAFLSRRLGPATGTRR
ncbi:NmrA family NAD(P)-binding protein [Streptomyces sp. 8L]|uniref:NmrA family NAD(P)-binding protein n=1 Tax=Streptomyces sp. 8L TaxID=2877242 RepID=UPI001CD7387E|nr:NmrA family NAD(P)-binding protein [Streptomyces sp. 8L]MCA1216938.1 NmrA family NAD(P)-binding protein [Streptomyces sp. 8L]